ncbi:MAG TPA: DJ-1/PfpI family protein [Thermodesulfobacteriota bacterium]|nr:DJ-1/PfpI family protein [Thermodesulfobacteriota bacterium]
MKIAFVVFNGLTTLDFIGIYDPLTRLKTMGFMPDLGWDICAYTDIVKDDRGLVMVPTAIQEPLQSYDVLVVPGGYGTRTLFQDKNFIEWIKTAEPCKLKVSVCTGALLLGAAGFLRDKRATTHRSAFQELEPFCQKVLDHRIVDEGNIITARGVSSGIDEGLYVVERLAGAEARSKIARQMDYPYTLQAGDVAK